jgi:hypothetical protein
VVTGGGGAQFSRVPHPIHLPLPAVAICTRSELEDFLSEAVCMKEFDHPNVMRLIGEEGGHSHKATPRRQTLLEVLGRSNLQAPCYPLF